MKKLLFLVLMALVATSASAATHYFGWEDGTSTVLETYPAGGAGAMLTYNVTAPDPVYTGSRSLKCVDDLVSGTPQAFICWVRGLEIGDEVYAGFYRYDDTPGTSPSIRISGHWNDDPLDITGYAGSAGYNGDYGEGLGWDFHDYTFVNGDGHTGLVIEARTYSNPGDTAWIDDLVIIAPDHDGIEVIFPDGSVPVENTTMSRVKALY